MHVSHPVAQQTYERVEFVHRAVSIHPKVTFGYPPTAEQSSLALIARFRVDFEHGGHQLPPPLEAASTGVVFLGLEVVSTPTLIGFWTPI